MEPKEELDRLVQLHDDTEDKLCIAEGETYLYLQEMLPIELFLRTQWQSGQHLSWDYTTMVQEQHRFRKLPPSMSIQISRHFRYDCSREHTHAYFQLNYVLEGTPAIHVGQKVYKAVPGDFFLLAPGVPHWIESFADDIIVLKVYIKYSTFENTFFRLLDEKNVLTSFFRRVLCGEDGEGNYICFHTDATSFFRDTMLETYRLFMNRVEYREIIMECRITELFCHLVRLCMEPSYTSLDTGEVAGVGRVLAYMRQHSETATLEDTAAWSGYSRNYLCRLLRSGTGQTFTELLNAMRIEKACQLLVRTDDPVTDIASRVGYGTIKHFYRVFHQVTDMTPGDYRKAHREQWEYISQR